MIDDLRKRRRMRRRDRYGVPVLYGQHNLND